MYSDKLTKIVISKMLKENTGAHFLDSGGAYGRHHEKNQTREFDNEPSVILRIDQYGIEYTRNIYHFLIETLTYEKELNNSLYAFEKEINQGKHPELDKYSNWYDITQAWLKHKGYTGGIRDNIYNYENNLSQVFIYELFSTENLKHDPDIYDCEFTILQIHGGCDVRGGYTSPKIFTWEDSFLMVADGYIRCEDNDHYWSTDDSYHWYDDGLCGKDYKNLETYELVDLHEFKESPEYKELMLKMINVPLGSQSFIDGYNPEVINPIKYPENTILYNEDSIGYCPKCSVNGVLSKLI
jgi:hypothetical protein